METRESFVHLHCHSHYSLLDGACTIDRLLELAAGRRMDALALTDHGNLFGAMEFYKKAKDKGVKPILGCEVYVAPAGRASRSGEGGRSSYHLTLIAENRRGYENLMRLGSVGYLEGFYYRPRVDHEALREHAEGLICLSGCLASEVNSLLTAGDYEGALARARFYQGLYGEKSFFVELMDHGLPDQQKNLDGLLSIAHEIGAPLVATNDVHYPEKGDLRSHEVLLCINTGKSLQDKGRMKMDRDEFHFASGDEMRERFARWPEALENTRRIADRCRLEIDFKTKHMPLFAPPDGSTPSDFFRRLCQDGLRARYGEVTDAHRERMEYEMAVIEEMGFVSYFLIVWDFIRFAREQGIPVGPGRGSAAGSIVAYVLRITDIDPLRYDLLFERFLNRERVSMPDIDIDFCQDRRGEVIEYVRRKYGEESVCQIITFNVMKARAVIRDVGRVLEIPLRDVDRVAKLVPDDLNITLAEALEKEPELRELAKDPIYAELFLHASKLEGLARHAGIHAAGVVIGDRPLRECVPLYKRGEDVTTQYSMNFLEDIGLLKMDFLGLRTLTMLREATALIARNHGIQVDLSNLPMDDAPTFDLMSRGESRGVFQMESSGFRDVLLKMRPNRFEDMIALVALYRPGPLGSGMVDTYCNRKHGEEKTRFDHPSLEGILGETHGVILYQEQVMRIANRMAGMSLNEADSLRKAMGKKKPEVMAKFRDRFIQGSLANGASETVAASVWEQMEYFAGYGFNKSHSAAYAYVGYQTAYIKANWPAEFMAATMSSWMQNTDKLIEYVEEVERLRLDLEPPDVNRSCDRFDGRGGTIVYGLAAVRGVGERAAQGIVAGRVTGPYRDIFDLTSRIDLRACNKGALEALVKAGAMDGLQGNRNQMLHVLDDAIAFGSRARADREAGQMSLFGAVAVVEQPASLSPIEELPEATLLSYEKEALGFFLSSHPLKAYSDLMDRHATARIATLKEAAAMDGGVTLCAMVTGVKKHIDKRGNPMAFLTVEDLTGTLEATVFASVFGDFRDLLQPEAILFFQGSLDTRRDEPSLLVERIIPPEAAGEVLRTNVRIDLPEGFGQASSRLEELRASILRHAGENSLFLTVPVPGGRVHIRAGDRLRVRANEEFVRTIRTLCGPQSITFSVPKEAPRPELQTAGRGG